MLGAAFRALRHRNYRLFVTGQSISLIGTWLTRVATSWLIYRLTGSTLLLGVVGFAGQIPAFVLSPLAGAFLDRMNRHRVLVVTQVLAMVQSALLAYFSLTGTIAVVHVLFLSAMQGLINAADMPARQSFVIEMIEDRGDLSNAIALNSSMVNVARFLGPSVAGVLIAQVGEGWCFLIDAVSYLPVIGSLLAMRIPKHIRVPKTRGVLADLVEGFRYAAGFLPIRSLLLLLSLVSLMGVPHQVLMPAFVSVVLKGDSKTLGLVMAASGIGALGGALYLASRRTVLGLGRIIAGSATAFGVALMLFSTARHVWTAAPLAALLGLAMIVQMAASNTVIQSIVEDDKRGRVMSLYNAAYFGTLPFGSLIAGAAAEHIGVTGAIFGGGVACVAGALYFFRVLPEVRRAVRPIYERLGILPDD